MAATATVQVHCPECDVVVPITLSFHATAVEGHILIIRGQPDLTDVIAHTWTHDDQTGRDQPARDHPGG